MYIGLQGFIGSGKDTAGRYLQSKDNFVKDSFARTLKDVCSVLFGWERELLEGDTIESREWREIPDQWWSEKLGIPNFTPRYAMQYMGTDILRNHFHPDIWLLTFQRRLESTFHRKNVILTDCRFKNEIDFFREVGGKIIFIDNGERPDWYEIALGANDPTRSDREDFLHTMRTLYSDVHRSEWDWIGTVPDVVIMNDFKEKNADTYKKFLARVDEGIALLSGKHNE